MTMSVEQLRAGLRARALKKRKLAASGLLTAQFAAQEESQEGTIEQAGQLSFRVLDRDAAGALKSFKVRTERGAEFIFKVMQRDGTGAVLSFNVEK